MKYLRPLKGNLSIQVGVKRYVDVPMNNRVELSNKNKTSYTLSIVTMTGGKIVFLDGNVLTVDLKYIEKLRKRTRDFEVVKNHKFITL